MKILESKRDKCIVVSVKCEIELNRVLIFLPKCCMSRRGMFGMSDLGLADFEIDIYLMC